MPIRPKQGGKHRKPKAPPVTPEETIQKAVDEAKKTRKPRTITSKAKALLGLS